MTSKIYDLTPKISPRLAVFPGDQPFERRVAMSMAQGHHLELSAMLATLHLGAHADAPSHYGLGQPSIADRPLAPYLGRAQVVRVKGLKPGARVMPEHVPQILAPRVLIDTGSYPDPNVWNKDFNSLSPELLQKFSEAEVVLAGIDTPSVDPETSQKLESHQVLLRRDISVLEGLLLKDVPEGVYTLIALPLPIVDGDASPVRAILLPEIPGFPDHFS